MVTIASEGMLKNIFITSNKFEKVHIANANVNSALANPRQLAVTVEKNVSKRDVYLVKG